MATIKAKQLDTGTTANKVVVLDSNAKLPAVAGDALTTLPVLNAHSNVNAASPSGGQVLTWDSTNSQWIAQDASSGGVFNTTDFIAFSSGSQSHTIEENEYAIISLVNTELTLELQTPTAATFYSEVDIYSNLDTSISRLIISNATGQTVYVLHENQLVNSTNSNTIANSGTLTLPVSKRTNLKITLNSSGIRIYVTENSSQGFGNLQFIQGSVTTSNLYPGTHFHNTSSYGPYTYTLPETSTLTGPAFFALSNNATSGTYTVTLSAADITANKKIYYYGNSSATSVTLDLGKGRVEYILYDGYNFKFITNPVKGPYVPQEYETGVGLSIGSTDEDKLFFLTDTNGTLEIITLPTASTIEDDAIFTINTATSPFTSTIPNQSFRLVFNLSDTDRTANEASNTVALYHSGQTNYQTSVTERSATSAYPDSKFYFWRNGTPIYIIKTADKFTIYGQAAYKDQSLTDIVSSTNHSLFYKNAWTVTSTYTNSNNMALPDLSNHEYRYGFPNGFQCITAKKQLGLNDISHPENIITHTNANISAISNGITNNIGVLNSNTGLYEYKTKARVAKFLKYNDKWTLVEEVGGINPCSLLERHVDGSYHILGDESVTAGGLKVYNESNTYASWLKAPSSTYLSANVNFVLPASEGTNGQVLQTDGNGNTSWVTASGGSRPNVYTQTSNFTIGDGTGTDPGAITSSELERVYLINNSSTAVTVTLPAISGDVGSGFKLQIKRLGTANVTVSQNGTEVIDGQNTQVLGNQYANITLVCDGSNWFIV